MANEPTYVDGGEAPRTADLLPQRPRHRRREGLVEVVAATDGLVVSAGGEGPARVSRHPASPRVTTSSTSSTTRAGTTATATSSDRPGDPPGAAGQMGQKIGVLGKEGGSGGWSHLHFDITSRQPSGKWGTQEGYAFLWQADGASRSRRSSPSPGPTAWPGPASPSSLDGRIVERAGPIDRFEWTFSDGTTATGPRSNARTTGRAPTARSSRSPTPGAGRLRLRHRPGARPALDGKSSPTIHAGYAPTLGIKPGDPVTFKVRTFRDPRPRPGTSATAARP